MGATTGIVLVATGISFGNEWLNTGEFNYRIPAAGLGTALVMDGIEMVDARIARGLALIMLFTVIVTPFNGKAPAQTAASLLDSSKKIIK